MLTAVPLRPCSIFTLACHLADGDLIRRRRLKSPPPCPLNDTKPSKAALAALSSQDPRKAVLCGSGLHNVVSLNLLLDSFFFFHIEKVENKYDTLVGLFLTPSKH